MIFDPNELDRMALNGLINGLVYPRPIAWVSTVSSAGQPNLAPFSFFNAFSFSPPTVAIGPGSRQGVNKDTLRNIRDTREFVISMVTEELAELANATSADFGPEINEWDAIGIEGAPCVDVAPQRVAASPAALECRVTEIVELSSVEAPTNSLVIGRVVRIHVDDRMLKGHRPDSKALKLVGRMGGKEWCTTAGVFELGRPNSVDPTDVRNALDSRE